MTRRPLLSGILSTSLAILIGCVISLADSSPGQAQGSALEVAVKATYLTKIPEFITWPSSTSPPATAFTICVVGPDPFGDVLDQAVVGQTVDGRPIATQRFPVVPDKPDCQIMYVSGSPAHSAATALARARGQPILTVTDGATDPSARGIFNFVIADNRVRFEIDNRAAAQSRLIISSKLLSLALIVRASTIAGEGR